MVAVRSAVSTSLPFSFFTESSHDPIRSRRNSYRMAPVNLGGELVCVERLHPLCRTMNVMQPQDGRGSHQGARCIGVNAHMKDGRPALSI